MKKNCLKSHGCYDNILGNGGGNMQEIRKEIAESIKDFKLFEGKDFCFVYCYILSIYNNAGSQKALNKCVG